MFWFLTLSSLLIILFCSACSTLFGHTIANIILLRTSPLREAKLANILGRADDCSVTIYSEILILKDKRTNLMKYIFIGSKPHARSFGMIFESESARETSRLSIASTRRLQQYILEVKSGKYNETKT